MDVPPNQFKISTMVCKTAIRCSNSALLHDITSRIELQVLHGIISLGVIGFRVKIALAATQRWQTVLSLSSAVSDSWSTAKDCLPSLITA